MKNDHRQRQSGQILVEYLLIVVVAVAIATLLIKTIVSRDSGNPGFIISAWNRALDAIGADDPGDVGTKK